MTYSEREFEIAKMRVAYWLAMAQTGAAKFRDIEVYDVTKLPSRRRQMTDEEKVKDAMDTALRHIHRMSEISEDLEATKEHA